MFALVTLLAWSEVEAQTIGRLRHTLAEAGHDSTKAIVMEALAWEYRRALPDSSRYFAEQALELAQNTGQQRVIAFSLTDLGNFYKWEGKDSIALGYHLSSLEIRRRLNSPRDLISGYNMLARAYRNLHDTPNAISAFQKGLRLVRDYDAPDLEAKLSDGLAMAYLHQGKLHLVGPLLAHALALHEGAHNILEIGQTHQNIGLYHQRLGQSVKALAAFEKAWMYYDSAGNVVDQAAILLNQGAILYQQGRLKASEEKLLQSLNLAEQHQLSKIRPKAYNNLALVYRQQGRLEEAARYHLLDIQLNRDAGRRPDLASGLIELAVLYLDQGQPFKAIPILKEAGSLISQADSNVVALLDLRKAEARAFADIGDFEAAFRANMAVENWEDSLLRAQQSAREFADSYVLIRQKNELLAKEAALQSAKAAQASAEAKQRGLLLVVLLLVGLVLVGFGISYIRTQQLKIRAMQAEKSARELESRKEAEIQQVLGLAESQAFRLRIETLVRERKRIARDLHDQLGNRLAMVQVMFEGVGTVVEQLPPKIGDQYQRAVVLLEAASDEVRKIAHNMHAGEIARYGLILSIENLCQQVHQSGKVRMRFESSGDMPKLPFELENALYAITSTLIQNILRHAAAQSAGIKLYCDARQITMEITDDGIGLPTDLQPGLGLKSVEEICMAWEGKLTLQPGRPGGTIVSVLIPVPPSS